MSNYVQVTLRHISYTLTFSSYKLKKYFIRIISTMKIFKSIQIIGLPSRDSWRNAKCRKTWLGITKLKLEFWGSLSCDIQISASWSNIDWTWQCFARGQYPTIGGEAFMMSHPIWGAICNCWLLKEGKCLFFKVATLQGATNAPTDDRSPCPYGQHHVDSTGLLKKAKKEDMKLEGRLKKINRGNEGGTWYSRIIK